MIISILEARSYKNPTNFAHAKNIMQSIYLNDLKTLYNQCEFKYDPDACSMNKVVYNGCKAHSKTHDDLVWGRVVSGTEYGKNLECMSENICKSMSGSLYHGARCCRKTSSRYQVMESDMFNIAPFISKRALENSRRTELPESVKGDIARIYLYMNSTYKLGFSKKRLQRYNIWHNQDSVSESECYRYKKIYKIQGRENPLMRSSCVRLETSLSKSSAL